MHLSTAQVAPEERSAFWTDLVCSVFVSLDCRPLGCPAMEGEIRSERVGDAVVSQVTSVGQRVDRTVSRIRQGGDGFVLVSLQLAGRATVRQDDRVACLSAGQLALYDTSRVYTLAFEEPFRQLVVQVPRERIERGVGDIRRFTARTIDASTPGGLLVSTYLQTLAGVAGRLDPHTGKRTAEAAMDLIVAAACERLGREPDGAASRTLTFQRAKAVIEENLHLEDLGPGPVAGRLGISARRLQELFREHGTTVSDWIWERRLLRAHGMLSDPALRHMSIGAVSGVCGFADQAHFSRRFRHRFATTPREVRAQARSGARGR